MLENILKKLIKKRKLPFLITNITNVRYLSKFTGSNGQILITKNNLYFFTDFRYLEQANKEIDRCFKVIIYSDFYKELKKIVKKENIKNIYFESSINYSDYINLKKKLKDVELKSIKKSIEITEKALKQVSYFFDLKNFKITEKFIANQFEIEIKKQGAEDVSFPVIVLSGKNSSLVHGKPEDNNLNQNILIDAGSRFKGYCSDKTVSIILDKNSEIKKIFTIVKDAKNFAIEKIKPGIKAKDIDKIAREYIFKKGFGKFFGHSLGHGVGLEVHELPVISPKSKDLLEEGNVITIEPGIYISGKFGIRLEDMVLIKSEGYEVLTKPAENFSKCLQV